MAEQEVPPYDLPPTDESASADEQERGREFIRLFNEIDHYVKRLVGSNGGEGFFRRLQWAVRDNPALKRYVDDLMEYSELRNAMVHDRQFPYRVIAVPTARTLGDFRRLVERIVRPRRVIPQFACSLRVFRPEEPLSTALEYMHAQGFTQVAARAEGQLCLLTAAGVTRWLAAHLAGPAAQGSAALPRASCVDFAGATVGDVLALEKPASLLLLPSHATLEEAAEHFQQAQLQRRGRLFAALITPNGRGDEDPLGIITPADLLDEDQG